MTYHGQYWQTITATSGNRAGKSRDSNEPKIGSVGLSAGRLSFSIRNARTYSSSSLVILWSHVLRPGSNAVKVVRAWYIATYK